MGGATVLSCRTVQWPQRAALSHYRLLRAAVTILICSGTISWEVLLLSNLSPEDQPGSSSLPCPPRPTLPDITCQGIGQVDSGGPSARPSSLCPPGHSHQPPLSSNWGLFCPKLFQTSYLLDPKSTPPSVLPGLLVLATHFLPWELSSCFWCYGGDRVNCACISTHTSTCS